MEVPNNFIEAKDVRLQSMQLASALLIFSCRTATS